MKTNAPYGMELVDDCSKCPLRREGFFAIWAMILSEPSSTSHLPVLIPPELFFLSKDSFPAVSICFAQAG